MSNRCNEEFEKLEEQSSTKKYDQRTRTRSCLNSMLALKDNPALVERLQGLKDQIFRTDDYGSKIEGCDLQNELDYAKDQLASLNSTNELTMMRLNMLVQQRSQVISSGSNQQHSID